MPDRVLTCAPRSRLLRVITLTIQREALANNDDPFENAGIGTAYNFASPANRCSTGPFTQFVTMVTGVDTRQ